MTDQQPNVEIPLLTRAQLTAAGYDGRVIRTRRRSGELKVVRKGLYADAPTLVDATPTAQHILAARAALQRVGAPAAMSHSSAAIAHRASLFAWPEAVSLTREWRCYAKFPGICVYMATLPPDHVTEVDGLPVTTPARTVVDIARHGQLAAGLVVADSMLRNRSCGRAELEQVLRECARWPGVRRAAAAIGHADDRAETALESVSRAGI